MALRLPPVALLLLALVATCFAAHAEPRAALDEAMKLLEEVPACAKPCLLTAMSNSTCSLGDVQCTCHDAKFEAQAEKCILASCTFSQALATKNVTSTACGAPIRDKSDNYSAMSISLGAITVFLVVVRILFKLFASSAQSLGPDDKVILGTLILRVSCTVINVEGLAAHGLGQDVWTLPMSTLTSFAMWLYIMEVLYLTELSLIKLSLSLFYLCIFPGVNIRRLLWGTAVLNILFGAAFVITAIFQCSPISYWWTQYTDEGAGKGKCINVNAMAWSNAAISVVIDVLMIAIPLSQISKLQLHWRKKLGVVIMFLIGAFVTVVSILRLRSLVTFANSTNPTWDQWEIAYWSTIEVNIGMICTCLPTLRLILLRLFPRIVGTTVSSSQGGPSARDTRGQSILRSRSSSHSHADHGLSDLDFSKGSHWQIHDQKTASDSEGSVPAYGNGRV